MTLIKNKKAGIIIQIIIWILTLVSTAFILKKTAAGDILVMPETTFMYLEILIVGLWIFAALYFIPSLWISYTVIAVVVYIYLWMHRIALPVLLSGLYMFYPVVVGEAFLNIIGIERKEDRIRRVLHDFISGMAVHLTAAGILSVFQIGGVAAARIIAISLFAVSAIYIGVIRFSQKRIVIPCPEIPSDSEIKKEENSRIWICIALAVMGAMMLLQAGRINITLDYDSLHYGLRSQYVLDNGHGFLENLGSINDVYVYPKGLEIFVLPLVTDVTYGFVLSFSWWMCAGVLLCIYYLVRKFNCRRAGVYAIMFAATVPGIMNMGISAKTDIITLLFQLIAIIDIIESDHVWAGSSLLMSLTLKPTSLMYSGLIFITALVFVIIRKEKICVKRWYLAIPVILAFGFVTARTVILSGMPITAAASQIWEAIGFEPKYPFDSVSGFGTPENVSLLKRFAGFFFCPITDDLFHVYIAWGGAGTAIMLMFGMLSKKGSLLLKLLTAVILTASIVCIFTLYQVDGNYFMLLYALSVVLFFISFSEVCYWLLPVIALNIVICGTTNWAGSIGLTPDRFQHLGFYDHESDMYDRFVSTGNKEIYEFLARDKMQRVIAFADQPDCLAFKCNVQSYTDIEGNGGNVYLVKTLDLFKGFLNYAGTDYIYVNDGFLENHERAGDIIEYMIEDGSLTEIIDEGSNRLYEYIQK